MAFRQEAFVLLWVGSAFAISGPWVVGERQLNVYTGIDAQRLERLQVQGEGGANADVIDVGEGLSTFGVKAIGTFGVASRVDIELEIPWYRVTANRADAELCGALGLGACQTTQGFGVVAARAKVLALDEVAGAPFSLAVVGVGRIGMFTHKDRARLTNLGEGTQDLGMELRLGRSGVLGQGFWSAHADVGFLYRFANTDSYPQLQGDRSVPGEEYSARIESVFSPVFRFGIGPSASLLYRPRGVDFLDADLTDVDRLSALRIGSARVGGIVVVRAESGISGSLSVEHTVGAFNNPYVTVVTAGMSFQGRIKE